MKLKPTDNRETWLRQLALFMAPRFEEHGQPIPPFRVGTGFTSGGQYCNAGGECWDKRVSADEHYEIFIMPDICDAMEIAAILCHELIHAAVGLKEGHKGKFAIMMGKLGLLRPYTTSTPGDEFKAWVQPALDKLGAIPHAALKFDRQKGKPAPRKRDSGDDSSPGSDDDFEPGSSNHKKKQATRMLKASCIECEYTIRLSKKWAVSHGAICPEHGAMPIEGIHDADESEDE